ncbi:type VII secretion target [Micromonospora craniellae]|uniref:ESX-1 secretion-associated protein n=1 Tax=Micromonospora craniellae TaxID=2294034 RepID=A0A372G2B1_9ACTN|nr:type VII secretion target [Micromonospora craniellae]QOC91776.1 ESX-1 secretion-associated protein [Micromonospora craniellae]RFS47152.1 ESX-1 secretion-associated protein [Micromonospora craniellae]
MPTGDAVRVDPDDLTAHAARLDRHADTLDTARRAGQQVRLDTDAYGRLCAIMPMLLDGLHRVLVDGIGTATTSVRDTATRLRTGADAYRAADARARHRLDRMRERRDR